MELQLHHIRANKHALRRINNLFLIKPTGKRASFTVLLEPPSEQKLNFYQQRNPPYIAAHAVHWSLWVQHRNPTALNKCKDIGSIDHSHAAMILTISSQFKSLPPHSILWPPSYHHQLLIFNPKWITAQVNHVERDSVSLCTLTWLGKPRHGTRFPKHFDPTSNPPEDLRFILSTLFAAAL